MKKKGGGKFYKIPTKTDKKIRRYTQRSGIQRTEPGEEAKRTTPPSLWGEKVATLGGSEGLKLKVHSEEPPVANFHTKAKREKTQPAGSPEISTKEEKPMGNLRKRTASGKKKKGFHDKGLLILTMKAAAKKKKGTEASRFREPAGGKGGLWEKGGGGGGGLSPTGYCSVIKNFKRK